MKLKLYLISQDSNKGYDTYDSAVVCCKNEQDAKNSKLGEFDYWVTPDKVKVELIGDAKKGLKEGIICSSFNAG